MAEKTQEMNEMELLPDGYMITYEQLNTLLAFQHDWMKYGMWLRSLLLCTTYNLPNKETVASHLFIVLEHLHDTFKVFYGPTVAQQLLNHMVKFTGSLWNLIDALFQDDERQIDEATMSAYRDGDRLAAFLAPINVYWDEAQWKNLFRQFTRLFIEESVSLLKGDYEQEITAYTRLEEACKLMGSYMARGVLARGR